MGNLVDTYIIKQKAEFKEQLIDLKDHSEELAKLIPNIYHPMFLELCRSIICMDDMMEATQNENILYSTLRQLASQFEHENLNLRFDSRYRQICLKTIIRKLFYDTLLIVEDDLNELKFNQYIIVSANSLPFIESQKFDFAG